MDIKDELIASYQRLDNAQEERAKVLRQARNEAVEQRDEIKDALRGLLELKAQQESAWAHAPSSAEWKAAWDEAHRVMARYLPDETT